MAALDKGAPGVHLWWLLKARERVEALVRGRLDSDNTRTSFYAASVIAIWGDERAEERLLRAVNECEEGPTPSEFPVPGAFAQCIDIPFWLQAILLLRSAGTKHCLPVLREVAETPSLPFNVRTIVALTLERLAGRFTAASGGNADTAAAGDVAKELTAALDALVAGDLSNASLPPSRSLWRTLHGEPQKTLINDRGADVAQDHRWQLHLVIERTRRVLGLPKGWDAEETFGNDQRAFVRSAFAQARDADAKR